MSNKHNVLFSRCAHPYEGKVLLCSKQGVWCSSWKSYLAMFSVRPTFETVDMFIILMGSGLLHKVTQTIACPLCVGIFIVSRQTVILKKITATVNILCMKCIDVFLQVGGRIHVCACMFTVPYHPPAPEKSLCNLNTDVKHKLLCS